MTVYTVHASAAEDDVGHIDPNDVVVVKEGFCWPALFFAVIWMIVRRMWIVLIAYLIVAAILSLLDRWLPGATLPVLTMAGAFWFALEANQLRRWTLERRGYRLVAVVEARDRLEAERRFFASSAEIVLDRPDLHRTPPSSPAALPPPAAPRKPGPAGDDGVIGLFPAPGR